MMMNRVLRLYVTVCALLWIAALAPAAEPKWTPAGWGGGGFYYSAIFHPTRDGVIYMGGDVNGMYKSEDHGKNWRIINTGISGYGVFALAVDKNQPDTIWAATDEGLSKSTDAGETWKTIPKSGKKELRLTGEKNKGVHNVAIDPTNADTVYVGTPHGKIYKTTDGGDNWTQIYARNNAAEPVASMRMQIGKVNDAIFGGTWMPLKFPESIQANAATGIGFSVKNEGAQPRDVFFQIRTSTGFQYRSRNLHDDFAPGDWRDIVLSAGDFTIDPEFKAKNAEKAAAAPSTPEWSTVNRFDFAAVGGFESEAAIVRMSRIFFAAGEEKTTAIDLSTAKTPAVYGNMKIGDPVGGPIFGVYVSPKDANFVAATSADEGLLLSTDAGKSWNVAGPMKRVAAVAISESDPNVLYAASMKEHVWKSVDKGVTWTAASGGIAPSFEVRDIVVSPTNPNDVYAIATQEWSGRFIHSTDGGASWSTVETLLPDVVGSPTLPAETADGKAVPISAPRNVAINPLNPKQLFIAANWRSAISNDAGRTWNESSRGADISCVADIRFHKNRVYAANMDEGILVTEDNGANWKQLWPLRHSAETSGHYWRVDIREVKGAVRILSANSPWDQKYNQVVTSVDDGKTFKAFRKGLPDYLPTANTMWGRGYARALAVDPKDPKVVYLGIDGDATPGKSGGGIFKSTDGGESWTQMANQPGSRRMFFGLAVDPTDSKRLYWGGCADKGGLYRSDDGGESWKLAFSQDQWIFNLHVTTDGTVYCLGKDIHRSTDHGQTWQKLTKLPVEGSTVVGFEVHPTDPKTMWAAANFWGGEAQNGGVFKTTDGGKTWRDITGDLPFRRPLVLRFNPATSELWAGFVGLYRLKQ